MDEKIVWLNDEILKSFMKDTFREMGLADQDAEISSDVLIAANRVGIDSHGIDRLKTYYYDGLKSKKINHQTNIEIVNETPTTAVIDGHQGIGLVIGTKSMDVAIRKAKINGLSMVAVRNSNHYGFAGYYAKMAVDEGMIGITGTNTPPYVAPTFSVENLLGTNPLTFGLPTDEEFPFIFDCATTVTALGKIQLYEKLNKELPEGWVMDNQGLTIKDAQRAHHDIQFGIASLLPLGGKGEENAGYKGYGYSTVVEILSSALQDNDYLKTSIVKKEGASTSKAIGHFFIVINIASFIELNSFKKTAGDILRTLRSSKKAPNAERIYTAGEKEYFIWLERASKGIPINEKLQKELLMIQKELSLKQYQFPF